MHKQLPLVLATTCFFVFAALLFVHPYLRASLASPYRVVYDPYQHATTFVLKDKYVGNDFYNGFQWETLDDPTHGCVNYVDQNTAKNNNLTQATDTKFFMRADTNKVVGKNARGRDSVRISSWAAYEDSVIVLDVQHMPEGCGTWPAFWTLSQKGPWPAGGEIDILEGVNLQSNNIATLHTNQYCTMPQSRYQSGSVTSTNCDANANFNQGCGAQATDGFSYGTLFNSVGGGYYVMSRTPDDGIKVWFWRRDDPGVPPAVTQKGFFNDVFGADQPVLTLPDPTWGPPLAYFPFGDFCEYGGHFDAHIMVFDLTFCGDWAGTDFASAGCGFSCDDFVRNSPDAFEDAYWEINSLHVFTPKS
ncbi:glycoside hydrolase family 16 protein [Phanerochaete carnosa HHB-10118-sp]|uniref:Glycoside hydrolase family 16 protein n=1 Tax=Phanerochaete carnosa (strain HHB-10118-sp) TaxID=650164 RepID=K5W6L8_PHACS|nr:glycoside hydrolase family 16 protein [Phanerochaete carnosa HHB-10118-sp]EKM54599.1 glycoside hydrolase family 16 protein [Phanerochaete carnosa HHB-10118-sp]